MKLSEFIYESEGKAGLTFEFGRKTPFNKRKFIKYLKDAYGDGYEILEDLIDEFEEFVKETDKFMPNDFDWGVKAESVLGGRPHNTNFKMYYYIPENWKERWLPYDTYELRNHTPGFPKKNEMNFKDIDRNTTLYNFILPLSNWFNKPKPGWNRPVNIVSHGLEQFVKKIEVPSKHWSELERDGKIYHGRFRW